VATITNEPTLTFSVSDPVKALGWNGICLVMDDLQNKESDPDFECLQSDTIQKILTDVTPERLKNDPILKSFKQIHEAIHHSNRETVAASENLLNFLLKTGKTPHINLLVDIYNLVSLETRLALGAHDVAQISGNVQIRLMDGTENFWPIGSSEPKKIRPGDYAYIDDSNDILCWLEVRQVKKTKVTLDTHACLYIIQGNSATSPEYLLTAANRLISFDSKVLRWPGADALHAMLTKTPLKLKGLIFDLDGTLLNSLPVCYIAFRKTFQKYLNHEYSDPEIAALFGPSEDGILKKLLPNCWQDALSYYLEEYERAHQTLIPFAGIMDVLTLLKAKKLRLAIISGKGPGSMKISLKQSGLTGFFETVITGSDQRANKPAHIHQLLRTWDYTPEEVAYIGDTAYDMEAAKEVGVWSIGALWADTADVRKVKAADPLVTFEDVAEFIQWIHTMV
jgi:pyrophosphatase PpaX